MGGGGGYVLESLLRTVSIWGNIPAINPQPETLNPNEPHESCNPHAEEGSGSVNLARAQASASAGLGLRVYPISPNSETLKGLGFRV